MARPWIEFVQSQSLPWRAVQLPDVRAGAECKVLSRDNETHACSLLMRYPAGWSAPGGALAVDEELFVVEGALQIDGRSYQEWAFARFPAGFVTGSWSSPHGAIVLEFFSGAPMRANGSIPYDERRLVEHLDALKVPYTGNFHPEFPPGAGRKILYQDPITLDTTWLLGTMPLRWAERSEVHPTVEEMYLLAGEVHGNRGVMRPGAYFWRPASKPHGPFGTQTGNLYFFRTQGGQLTTTYMDAERPFRWWPAYDPVLPPEMQAYRGEAPSGARRW
ncbi:MAG TPA: DUF4437 domain-containing protein [Steroidobacteraceae bacterium]|nr:DUF4437 domain-containing protein [Steroidobacteraceae bacterium]